MLQGVVALLLLALLFDFLFYKGHSQSSCKKKKCMQEQKTSLTNKYTLFTECVCFKSQRVSSGCAGCDLPRVRLTKPPCIQNKSSMRLLQPSNDTYQWWIQTRTHLSETVAPSRLWNCTQVIIRSACRSPRIGDIFMNIPGAFFMLLPAVKQRRRCSRASTGLLAPGCTIPMPVRRETRTFSGI